MSNASEFNVWAFSCAHVGTDKFNGRESLADAIRQSEGRGDYAYPGFAWDIAINCGDNTGAQGLPRDEEGEEVVRQFGAMREHRREQVYDVCGNHDRSGKNEEPNRWWRKWIDPTGENTEFSTIDPAHRPYPVDGTWERYSFRVGNLLFLMMSDVNDTSDREGRDTLGGNPAGVVRSETFEWWKDQVESNPDSLVVSIHHYVLKDTTVASGEFEGMFRDCDGGLHSGYHGFKNHEADRGASYLYYLDDRPDAHAFEQYLEGSRGATDLWIAGHTHTHPEDRLGGKSHIETKWGTHFINCAALTRYHGFAHSCPMSRVLTFADRSDEVRVRCYLHSDSLPSIFSRFQAPPGWYLGAERTLKLVRPFERG